MNLNMVQQILMEKVKHNEPLTEEMITLCYDAAEIFEKLAVSRGYIIPENCNICGTELVVIDTSTAKDKSFRAQCSKCYKKSVGTTKKEALINFWSKE